MKPVYLTVGMVALLVALGGYVLLFENKPVPQAVPSEAPRVMLLQFPRAQLQRLEIDQNSPSRSAVLERKGAQWLIDGKPADAGRVDTLLTELENWQAEERLETRFPDARASEFGLEPADLIVRLYLAQGRVEQFKIGSKTPTSSGYYVLKQGDPALYLAYINQPEDLSRLISQPPVARPSPVAPTAQPAKSP